MLKNDTEKEEKLIISRAEDAAELAGRKYMVKAVGFLNPRQRSLIMKSLKPSADITISFEGGYADAERTMLICAPEFTEPVFDDIISVIRIHGRDVAGLTHRDYLGSIMGLGIKRENIGDILVVNDGAFVFVRCEIADYIMQNLDKIGRHGIKTEKCRCAEADIPKPKLREISGTVSSLRLDAVLAFAAGVARTRAVELIKQGLVSLNFEVVPDVAHPVEERDLISARGFGRMRIEKAGGLTRKGRTGIVVSRFE